MLVGMPMTPEVRQKWTEAWREARAAKDERRKANRAKWAERRDWSDDNEHKIDVALEDVSDVGGGSSSSLDRLRALMGDPNVALHRRIDAAEVLVPFEIAPGAASNVDPDEVAAKSFQFLRAVIDAKETPPALAFRALKLVAGIENARASIKANSITLGQRREMFCHLVNATRLAELRRGGIWHRVVASGERWWIGLEDDFELPRSWLDSWTWPPSSFAEALSRGEGSEALRAELRTARARNRLDDWERLLLPGD
jgi:hypothetical protein